MKTLLNYQLFTIESNQTFLNVATLEDLKAWKKLYRQYTFLHNLGVKISKANREYVFRTLNNLNDYRTQLIKMIESGASDEDKEELKEKIELNQTLLNQLSLLKDEVKEGEGRQFGAKLMTILTFTQVIEIEGEKVYKTKNRKTYKVKDGSKYEQHLLLIQKHFDALEQRKAEEKKAIKSKEKAEKKSNNFVEQIEEKKIK